MDEERPMGLDSSSIVECSNSQCARAKDQQDNSFKVHPWSTKYVLGPMLEWCDFFCCCIQYQFWYIDTFMKISRTRGTSL